MWGQFLLLIWSLLLFSLVIVPEVATAVFLVVVVAIGLVLMVVALVPVVTASVIIVEVLIILSLGVERNMESRIDRLSPQPVSTSGSHDALTAQMSELVQALQTLLPASSTATLTSSSKVACVATSGPSLVLDSGASSHMSGTSSLFSELTPITQYYSGQWVL